jgi:ribosomal protein S14
VPDEASEPRGLSEVGKTSEKTVTNAKEQTKETEEQREDGAIRCDICGAESSSVRRVALDRQYDRLRKPHQVLYACPPCSEKKERQRLGLERN